jgi:hypothetical protein
MIDNEFMHEIVERLIQHSSELSGQWYISEVFRYCLPANALYMPGHVVDHGFDTPIESFVVHFPYVEVVEPSYDQSLALFLIFLNNVPYA